MPRTKNEYTAVAGAEKRLREILVPGLGQAIADDVVDDLTRTAEIEYKPRLKAIVITLPIPEPAPEPKLGKFAPVPVAEDYEPQPDEDEVAVG